MSLALYKFGGLRFWSQDQIQLRDQFRDRVISVVKYGLASVNNAWRFEQTEGPCLTPSSFISDEYTDDDLFVTNHIVGGEALKLRAETTPSSYAYARHLGGKLPLCVYQYGKSFRRETNDGASAGKLRFNEFHQLEFQCIYPINTKCDYRAVLIPLVAREISRFTQLETRVVDSDRIPSYSEGTKDIEVLTDGKWREIASCSIRNDYSDNALVCEIAIGLCRVASLVR